MSWSRFDDAWSQRTVWEHVDLAARWHYMCLVQECSRNKRFDGCMPLGTARRASDVSNPNDCIATLEAVSLIEVRDEIVTVMQIDEHIPPPSVRENAEKSAVRMSRMRKHKNGDHTECLSEHCDKAVTAPVTRNTRTGQDGLQTQVPIENGVTVTRNTSNDNRCGHGVDNGSEREPWRPGELVCRECTSESAPVAGACRACRQVPEDKVGLGASGLCVACELAKAKEAS